MIRSRTRHLPLHLSVTRQNREDKIKYTNKGNHQAILVYYENGIRETTINKESKIKLAPHQNFRPANG
jgi:hypothetical protein